MYPLQKWTPLLVAGGLLALLAACGGAQATATATPTPGKAAAATTPVAAKPTATPTKAAAVATPTAVGSTALTTGDTCEVVQVTMTENPYTFAPDTFSFQTGKTYTLQFNVPGEFHTFTLADLGIDIYVDAGRSVKQTVTFNKAGKFKLLCTVHQDIGMAGTVTVS